MSESLPVATSVRPALVRLIDAITEAVREHTSEILLYGFITLLVMAALLLRRLTWF
jgi:hypothetical protein